MGNLKEFVGKHTTVSRLASGNKLSTDDIIDMELTIIDFDFVESDNGKYSVVRFSEIKDGFYFGGTVLTNILSEIAEHPEFSQELRTNGLRVKLSHATSRAGRKYVKVTMI